MCGTDNIDRLKLYRTQIKIKRIEISEIDKINIPIVEWQVLTSSSCVYCGHILYSAVGLQYSIVT
jgi:hypothetical protein